jgi:hypothetical protein
LLATAKAARDAPTSARAAAAGGWAAVTVPVQTVAQAVPQAVVTTTAQAAVKRSFPAP